jgi:hypothetical protein
MGEGTRATGASGMTDEYGFHKYLERRRRRLTNLRIDEVSSVDLGAGHGVRVVLTKRDDNTRGIPMSFSPIQKADKGCELFAAGHVSAGDLNDLFEVCAQEAFPNDADWRTKALNTPWGQKLISKSAAGHRFDLQTMHATGDGATVINKRTLISKSDPNRPRNTSDRHHMAGADINADVDPGTLDPAGALKALAEACAARDKVDMSKAFDTVLRSALGQKLMAMDKARSGNITA